MYKDKDKQREANKEAAKRYRDSRKGMTASGPSVTIRRYRVIPCDDIPVIPKQDKMLVGDLPPKEQAMVIKALSPIPRQEAIAMPTQVKPEAQSHNPMMVGYVPPKE